MYNISKKAHALWHVMRRAACVHREKLVQVNDPAEESDSGAHHGQKDEQ